MMEFLNVLKNILGHLYSLLLNSTVASCLGINVFWALFGFFVMWSVISITVFRGSIAPGSVVTLFNSFNTKSKEANNK